MRWDRLTLKVQEAMQAASDLADSLNHQAIEPEHVLIALLDDKDGLIRQVVTKAGAEAEALREDARRVAARFPIVSGVPGHTMSPRLNRVMQVAWEEAQHLKDEYLSVEHVLLAFADSAAGELAAAFKRAGVTKEKLWQALTEVRGGQRVTDQAPEDKYQALERYCRDLTDAAKKGKLDPVIGREDEIRRVQQVL
ncbi:MAG: Clp protease N-terminal domain-containing protein, partial [bacterium]